MKRIDPAIVLLLFIVSFGLYIRTLAPSLLTGDSAEFQTIATTLGIGHPTGYPVYILLARLFTLLPTGELAASVNLFSAFSAALTVALVYLILRKLGAWRIPAIFGSLVLALTPLFWKQASIAEVYATSAVCLAFLLFAVLQWRETGDSRWLFLAGVLGGLSLGIHTAVALSAPAVLLYMILTARRRIDWVHAALGALTGALIFFTAFIFLDWKNSPAGYYNAVVRPSLSVWNMTPLDFDSPFERLAFLYFPPQFRGQFFGVAPIDALQRLENFTASISWKLILALPGLIVLLIPRRKTPVRWREAVLLSAALIGFLAFAATYNVDDFHVYLIPAALILAVFMGLGVNAIFDMAKLIPKIPGYVPAVLGMLIIVIGLVPNAHGVISAVEDRMPPGLEDWETSAYNFPHARLLEAEHIVDGLEDNAIVFTDWDRVYDYYYVAHVLRGRTAMDFHETFPQEGVTRLADSAVAYIEANIDSRPIYFSERPTQLANNYRVLRTGFGLYHLIKK